VLGKRDIALLVLLAVVILPDVRGLQFAGVTVFFYLPLAFVSSLLPCVYITRWLLRQAPGRVPVYEWIMRLLDERWRSFVLFLTWPGRPGCVLAPGSVSVRPASGLS
jgi:hypothetical protein